jgi:hypothetical protein
MRARGQEVIKPILDDDKVGSKPVGHVAMEQSDPVQSVVAKAYGPR